MKHFQDGNIEVDYDTNMFASRYAEDYSDYDKSLINHSADEDFYNSYNDEGGIKHFSDY